MNNSKTGIVVPTVQRNAEGVEDVDAFFASPKPKTPAAKLKQQAALAKNGVTPRSPSRLQQVTNRAQTEEEEDEDDEEAGGAGEQGGAGGGGGGGGDDDTGYLDMDYGGGGISDDQEEDMQVDDGKFM